MKRIMTMAAIVALAGCTSVKVKPVDPTLAVDSVCIRNNPAVKVDDFIMVMQEGFQRHGIAANVYYGDPPASCTYVVDYTALRSWDLAPYLSHAEIRITTHGRPVASADYHLNGKGGFSLAKFKGTRSKIAPVMDKLLAGLHGTSAR